MKNKEMVVSDPPSCDFLEKNIEMEEEAIEEYIRESYRTDDQLSRVAFHAIAVEEMVHLELLEDLKRRLGC